MKPSWNFAIFREKYKIQNVKWLFYKEKKSYKSNNLNQEFNVLQNKKVKNHSYYNKSRHRLNK
jgi:hypothetical protein